MRKNSNPIRADRIDLNQKDRRFSIPPGGNRLLALHRAVLVRMDASSRVPSRIDRQKVAQLDWHNDASRLILDINDALTAATDEKARGVVIRRLRRALNEVVPPVPPAN